MSRQQLWLRIAADHPALAGHFPDHPIVPGVLLLDEALHAIETEQFSGPDALQITTVKFHQVVLPEQELTLEFEIHSDELVHFKVRRREALVVSGTVKHRPKIRALESP